MRIAYFANDGTEFHNREACEAYEGKNVILPANVIALDYENKILPYSCDDDFFDEVKFIYFKNKDAVEAFHNEMGEVKWINKKTGRCGYCFREKIVYCYDDEEHEFVEVEGSVEYYKEKIKTMNAGKKRIEKEALKA